ncbi:AraC family transcriptional regulator [bacterium]|nr:MAG: AraC family transcriptional regulator [bacterium]
MESQFTVGQKFVRLSGTRPVQWQRHTLREGVGPHDHEFTELVIVKSGAIPHKTYGVNGEEWSEILGRGNAIVVPPGLIHAFERLAPAQECQLVNIYYLPEWFLWDLNTLWDEGLLPLFFATHLFRRWDTLKIWRINLTEEELLACERELDDIGNEYVRTKPSLLFARSAFFKILVILARAWSHQTPQHGLHLRPEIWEALQEIDRCIKDGAVCRVDVLARHVGFATSSFSRIFRSATGLSPSEYLGRRRIQHAAHLLLKSDLSIGAIASRLGFCDSSHLSHSFLQNQGITPHAFRKRYREYS